VAKTWYPVIDYVLCAECGSCVTKCSHGVYSKVKAPVPVVEKPEACVDHCHGCGNICPSGAITYLGEDTAWTPPHGKPVMPEAPCGCGCGTASASAAASTGGCACESAAAGTKTVAIDYLYLDLTSCERCIGTDQVLDEVVAAITPALKLAGYQVAYQKTEMATADIALQHRFQSSPTIRVNGRDIATAVAENHCGCCSAISNSDVDCRVFEYEGATYEVPPKQMLAEGILRAVFGSPADAQEQERFQLPDNLISFFNGKTQQKCACGGNCGE
jgi:NAD-dependent dihydropyrimidine dehydrogenase PreA subunit